MLENIPDDLKGKTSSLGEASLSGHLKNGDDEKKGSDAYVPADPSQGHPAHRRGQTAARRADRQIGRRDAGELRGRVFARAPFGKFALALTSGRPRAPCDAIRAQDDSSSLAFQSRGLFAFAMRGRKPSRVVLI